MNKDLIDKLETWVGEFFYLFQEWVVFSRTDKQKIEKLLLTAQGIVDDDFFNVEGDNRTPTEKRMDKIKAEAIERNKKNSEQSRDDYLNK